MKVRGVSPERLREIAAKLGFKLQNERTSGRFHAFVLRMATITPRGDDKGRYRKRGFSERWTCAVCVHGHRVFYEKIFDENPEALIVTMHRRWTSRADLDANWARVAMVNVGSAFLPITYGEQCDC